MNFGDVWFLIRRTFSSLTSGPFWKIAGGGLIWFCNAVFGGASAAVLAVIILWTMDLVTGITRARLNPSEKVTSRRMMHGLIKLGIYMILLSVAHQCGKLELIAMIGAMIQGFIILTEGYSILENVQKIGQLTGTKIDIIDKIMSVIQGKIEEMDEHPRRRKTDENINARRDDGNE